MAEPNRLGVRLTDMQRALTVLALALVAGCTSSAPQASRSSGPSPSATPTAAAVAVSPEPTPYTVPTTPATSALVKDAPALPIAPGKTLPWTLARLPDEGRTVIIRFSAGCTAPAVEWDESPTTVRVRVPYPSSDNGMCLVMNYRALHLAQPLGERRLLHVTG